MHIGNNNVPQQPPAGTKKVTRATKFKNILLLLHTTKLTTKS